MIFLTAYSLHWTILLLLLPSLTSAFHVIGVESQSQTLKEASEGMCARMQEEGGSKHDRANKHTHFRIPVHLGSDFDSSSDNDTGDTLCPRNREEAGERGRQCLRKCRTDANCISNKKRCLCDGLCGWSCVRPGMLYFFPSKSLPFSAPIIYPLCNKFAHYFFPH